MDEESSSSSSSTSTNEYEDSEFYHSSSSHAAENENETETASKNNSGDDGFNSPVQPMSSLNEIQPKPEPISVDDLLCRGSQNDSITASICHDTTFQPVLQASHEVSSSTSPISNIPHRGALRRILNPSSLHVGQNNSIGAPATATHQHSNQQNQAKHGEVVYAINVATDVDDSICSQNSQQQSNRLDQYQLIFDRQQYEFCTRLFALLDKESQSTIGPECIQEFVCLHCPVVRRRDDAIFALRYNSNEEARSSEDSRMKISLLSSPTFDEIWEKTVQSTTGNNVTTNNPTIQRIGIEGWMVFCRLLSLAQHQESQRRFASRHLQQMCVHKHSGGGGGNTRLNPNEIVVVVDNPPPGPPLSITIQSLVDIEQERATASSHVNNESIPGWPFCPLPLPELDLDHCLVSTYSNNRYQRISSEMHQRRGSVSIEPFSSSQDGDFILRYNCNDTTTMVVRRSYLDFEWLNTILKLHKRPGQGHLCGRILPPFPSKQGYFHQQRSGVLSRNSTIQRSRGDSNSQKDISERAISVAKSGVGIITSMAKSVWSGYVSGASSPSSTQKSKTKQRSSKQQIQWASQSKQDVPTEVAKKLERYLNYLLKNSALSSSFPLNAILQASQSGLESTKQILQEHTKKKKKKTQQQGLNFAATTTPKEGGLHSAASIFSTLVSKSSLSIMRLQGDDDTSWLRAAAQVAMALQFHGILETTGNESTSAKIQHASLPKFQNQPTGSWDEEDGGSPIDDRQLRSSLSDSPKGETDFEQGIVNVESELVDSQDIGGYDLLPSPGPSDEHRVLNAGSVDKGNASNSPSKSRFVYETASSSDYQSPDRREAVLGTIRVDNDIDKLRDIIRSISQTLGKLHQSSASIQSAQNERNVIQSDILRNVDSWGDTGDEIISQRALVNGVASLELFNNIIAESNMTLTDDLSWQSSLASSAVDAVTEVRDAVRASRTASRAKSAAYIAAEKAKKTYESCDHSSSKEKIQHTQSEASKAQSHAIHATVVEYEANIAKKRSAVSLAQDVKSWNQHRKKELCRSCVQFARSQQEACRKSADAWGSLREGLINKSTGSFATDDASLWVNTVVSSQVVYQGSSTALGTLTHGKPVYTNVSDFQESNNLETSSDWETGVDASNSLSSSSKGFTDLKQSRESSNVYCLSSQNIDDDYFSFHQSIASSQDHSVNNDDDYNEDRSGAGSCQSDEVDEPVEGLSKADPMSTSMQSLIDGLMSWGEQEQSNRSGGDNTNLLD